MCSVVHVGRNADVVKIMCIVAIRSFLGWERGKEMAHMQHEVDAWKKAHNALLRWRLPAVFPPLSMRVQRETRDCNTS